MKKELYSVCELCKNDIFDEKDCVEVINQIQLAFLNHIPKGRGNSKEYLHPLYVETATLCTDCFFEKNSIKKAIVSRWYTHKLDELIETSQSNFDKNSSFWKGMKTKNKNKILKKLINNQLKS